MIRYLLFSLAIMVMTAAQLAAQIPTVLDTRLGVHDDKIRFVVELDQSVPYALFTIPNPNRLVLDLPELQWTKIPATQTMIKGAVIGFRTGLFRSGVTRVVLDLKPNWKISRHFKLASQAANGNISAKNNRIVIDLVKASKSLQSHQAEAQKNNKGQTKANKALVNKPLAKQTSADWQSYIARITREANATPKIPEAKINNDTRKIVALDPGHGGVDPGAIGITGTYEKTVTLAMAKIAKKHLESTGRYRVILTRARDIYVPLRQRYAKAETQNADIFISIHADSHSKKHLRGATVYTLSNTASDKEADRLATKENKSDIIAGQDLSGFDSNLSAILIDMAQGNTNKTSWQFAENLVSSLKKQVAMRKNPHRYAGFAVLKSPNMPSILLEMGYLSNRQDEAILKRDNFRKKISLALLEALDSHFAAQAKKVQS